MSEIFVLVREESRKESAENACLWLYDENKEKRKFTSDFTPPHTHVNEVVFNYLNKAFIQYDSQKIIWYKMIDLT